LSSGKVPRRIKIRSLVTERRHREKHSCQHRGKGKDKQDQPLMLGFHLWSLEASPSARRIAAKLHSASPPVPDKVTT
jgi:hypothetical protein